MLGFAFTKCNNNVFLLLYRVYCGQLVCSGRYFSNVGYRNWLSCHSSWYIATQLNYCSFWYLRWRWWTSFVHSMWWCRRCCGYSWLGDLRRPWWEAVCPYSPGLDTCSHWLDTTWRVIATWHFWRWYYSTFNYTLWRYDEGWMSLQEHDETQ